MYYRANPERPVSACPAPLVGDATFSRCECPSLTFGHLACAQAERDACKEDPDCEFDATVKDGSFARVEFKSRDEAEVEIGEFSWTGT